MSTRETVEALRRSVADAFSEASLRAAVDRLVHGPPALQRGDGIAAAVLAVVGVQAAAGGAPPLVGAACALLVLVRRLPVPVTTLLVLLVALASQVDTEVAYLDQWGLPVYHRGDLLLPALALLAAAGYFCGRAARVSGWLALPLLPCLFSAYDLRVTYAFALLLGLAVGSGLRAATEERELRSRAQGLEEVTQVQRAEQIGLEERGQLARELHDIVGHHVTAVVVLAEAAQARGAGASPDLVRIADTARAALGELDTLVTALRDPAARAETTTPPGLDDLPELLDPLQHAGVTASLQVSTRGELAQGVQLTAYRIVQEGLTNVMRHAGARVVRVCVAERDGTLLLTVDDDGAGFDPAQVTRGRGLLGIGERVQGHGGTWASEPSPLGGSRLRAELPVVAAARPAPVT